jgi:hypothetical protein
MRKEKLPDTIFIFCEGIREAAKDISNPPLLFRHISSSTFVFEQRRTSDAPCLWCDEVLEKE